MRQRVEHAAAAAPKQPTPYIPRLANPTPAQARAALTIARNSQHQALGPNPGTARIQAYQQQLGADPRQREYLATLEHYARALALHEHFPAVPHATASPAPAGPSISLPVLGTIVPSSTIQGIQGAVASKLAEDLPQLEGTGKAIKTLLTGGVGEPAPNKSILSNAAIDLAQLPAGVISSLVQTGAAGVDAVKGNTGPAQQILSGLAQTFEHPLTALRTRPISTGLVLAGGEEAAGRLAGAVARTGALGEGLARAAATERTPLQFYNGMGEKRSYSPAVTRKGIQVAADKLRGSKLLSEGRRQLDPNQATGVRLQRAIEGGVTRPGEVDINVAGGEQMRKALKQDVMNSIGAARPKHGADAVPLIVERVVRSPQTLEADLKKEELRLIAAQHGHTILGPAEPQVRTDPLAPVRAPKLAETTHEPLTGADLAENRTQLEQVQKLLADKTFMADPAPAFAAAQHYIEATAPLTAGLQRVGHFSDAQVGRAPLFPYAQAHMGARYFSEANHAAAESTARAAETEARGRLAQLEPGSAEHAHVLKEVAAARGQRYAVSGRGRPEDIAAHEQTIQEHADARQGLSRAQSDLQREEARRNRLVGSQRRARASERRAGTADEQQRLAAADAKVRGAKEGLAAARARVVEARDAAAASKLPRQRAGMRTATGEYLPNEAILAHMHENGVEAPGFLTHEGQGRGAYFRSTTRRPGIASKQRTGSSFVKGTYDRSYEALARNGSDLANKYAGHHATDARLERFGIGKYASLEDAAREAENFSHTPEGERITQALGELVPVPVGPERVRAAGRVALSDAEGARQQFGVEAHKQVEQAANLAQAKYTLLPRTVMKRLGEHDALLAPSEGKKMFQKTTNQWRQTALFTSPRWLLGSPQEHGIRLAIGGAAPKFLGGRSGRFGAQLSGAYDKIASEGSLDSEAARLAHAELIKGTLYGSAEELKMVRAADQFQSSPVLGPALHQVEAGKEAKVGAAALAPWRTWHKAISNGMVKLERESRRASLGKNAIKEIHAFNGKWSDVMKMNEKQVEDFVRGTLNPMDTRSLVKGVDEMMGAYGHLTPTVRSAVQTWSPFGLWWLTSMRYLRRMPIDHPTKTAILAALHNAVAANEQQGAEPSYLKGGIHVGLPLGLGGATLQPTYYSPGGVSLEPMKTAADMVAPLETENVGAALGLDTFKGGALSAPHQLKGEATEGQRPGIILNNLLSGLIPGYRQAVQLRENGGVPYSTSNLVSPTVKPGTQRDLAHTIFKLLSPERFTYDKEAGRGGGPPLSPAAQRAVQRTEHTSAFDEARLQRAIERSER